MENNIKRLPLPATENDALKNRATHSDDASGKTKEHSQVTKGFVSISQAI